MTHYQEFDAPAPAPSVDFTDESRLTTDLIQDYKNSASKYTELSTREKYLAHLQRAGFAEDELAIAVIEYEWGRVPFILKWDKFRLKIQKAKKLDHKCASAAVGGNFYQVMPLDLLREPNIWQWLEEQCEIPEYRGLHIYPNLKTSTAKEIKGVSGLKDDDNYFSLTSYSAKQFKAIWFECDDRTKEEQIALIASLDIELGITPAIVVDTMGKSLHTYYSLTEDVSQETWVDLQKGLIARCHSDPNLFRVAGAMRLAGSPRRLKDGSLVETQIAYLNDEKVDPDVLFSKLEPFIPKKPEPIVTTRTQSINFNHNTDEFVREQYVPLDEFLSQENRNLFNQGLPEGSSFSLGQKIVAALKTIENGLNAAGIPYVGTAIDLIQELCERSNRPKRIKDFVRFANKINSAADISYLISRYRYLTGQITPKYEKRDDVLALIGEQEERRQKEQEDAMKLQSNYEATRKVLQQLKEQFVNIAKKLKPIKTKSILKFEVDWKPYKPWTTIKDLNGIAYIETKTFDIRQRIQIIKEAFSQGFRTILFADEMGLGKSYFLGQISASDFYNELFVKQIEMLAAQKKTNGKLSDESQDKEYVPTMHYISQTGSSPIDEVNDTYNRVPTRRDVAEVMTNDGPQLIPGNCHLSASQNKAHERKIETEGVNPICHKCPYYLPVGRRKDQPWCGGDVQKGNLASPDGYLLESKLFWEKNHSRIRSTLLGYPIIPDKQAISIAVIDEATKLLKPKEIILDIEEITRTHYSLRRTLQKLVNNQELIDDPIITEIASKAGYITPSEAQTLIDLIDRLKASVDKLLFDPDLKKQNPYGLDHELIITYLKEANSGFQLPEVKDLLSKLFKLENTITQSAAYGLPQSPTPEDVERLPRLWVSTLLTEIFDCNDRPFGLSINNSKLSLSPIDPGLRKLGNFAALILLDASGVLLFPALKKYLDCMGKMPVLGENGFYSNKVLVIRAKPIKKSNLIITQYQGAKLESNNRSTKAQNKVNQIKALIRSSDPTSMFIDHKKYCQGSDLYHMSADSVRGARGSNTVYLNGTKNLTSFGTPNPNRNAVKAEYYALGLQSTCDFDTYYNTLVAEQILQEGGRLRAIRRLDEQLFFNLMNDFDLSWMQDFGYNAPVIKSFDTEFPDLGTAPNRHLHSVINYLKNTACDLTKITLTQIANAINVTKSRVSEVFKPWGGFSTFVQLFKNVSSWQDLKGRILHDYPDEGFEVLFNTSEFLDFIGSVMGTEPRQTSEQMNIDSDNQPITQSAPRTSFQNPIISLSVLEQITNESYIVPLECQKTNSKPSEETKPDVTQSDFVPLGGNEGIKRKLVEQIPDDPSDEVKDMVSMLQMCVDSEQLEELLACNLVGEDKLSEAIAQLDEKGILILEWLAEPENSDLGSLKEAYKDEQQTPDLPTITGNPITVDTELKEPLIPPTSKPIKAGIDPTPENPPEVQPEINTLSEENPLKEIELPTAFSPSSFGLKLVTSVKQLIKGAVVWFAEGFRKETGKSYLKKTTVEKLSEDYLILENGSVVLEAQLSRMLYIST